MDQNIKQILPFLILMGCDLTNKSPNYIIEKFRKCSDDRAFTCLDLSNMRKLAEYLEKNSAQCPLEQWIEFAGYLADNELAYDDLKKQGINLEI